MVSIAGTASDEKAFDLSGTRVEVRTYKFDGLLHRTWEAHLVRQDGPLILLDARFRADIIHDLLGTIASGTHSLEYYWLDRWYNVFRFADPSGELKNYYCNINVPPKFVDGTLSYVDLDLDILVAPDFSYQILDHEEFEENARRYAYSAEIKENAGRAVDELVRLIEARDFPFSS
jgi:protein associated with RNAse G/E